MAGERYIKAIIYVTVLAWTVVLYVNHEAIKSTWLQPLSTVITIVLYAAHESTRTADQQSGPGSTRVLTLA